MELSGRYFDALLLLLREPGQLISKERFFEVVWNGVIVTDSALTQCIKEIRRQLGDDASSPRYVETVPRHGYRFVAPVVATSPTSPREQGTSTLDQPGAEVRLASGSKDLVILDGLAGTVGGGAAGLVGGLFYGSVVSHAYPGNGVGMISTLAVFAGLGILIGLVGGSGVGFGLSVPRLWTSPRANWRIVGASLGGLLVGALADLLGSDVFILLFGRSIQGITGAWEGALVGATLAIGFEFAGGRDARNPIHPVLGACLGGAMAGVLIPWLGGEIFASSLNNLVGAFSRSKLQLAALGGLFGDTSLGLGARMTLGGIEVSLFSGCVALGLVLASHGRRRRKPEMANGSSLVDHH